jgi:hypothetical protein
MASVPILLVSPPASIVVEDGVLKLINFTSFLDSGATLVTVEDGMLKLVNVTSLVGFPTAFITVEEGTSKLVALTSGLVGLTSFLAAVPALGIAAYLLRRLAPLKFISQAANELARLPELFEGLEPFCRTYPTFVASRPSRDLLRSFHLRYDQ